MKISIIPDVRKSVEGLKEEERSSSGGTAARRREAQNARRRKRKPPQKRGHMPVEIKKSRRPPTFPPLGSIIGAGGLDFRVRDGNGYGPSAMAAGILRSPASGTHPQAGTYPRRLARPAHADGFYGSNLPRRGTVIWPSLTAY